VVTLRRRRAWQAAAYHKENHQAVSRQRKTATIKQHQNRARDALGVTKQAHEKKINAKRRQ